MCDDMTAQVMQVGRTTYARHSERSEESHDGCLPQTGLNLHMNTVVRNNNILSRTHAFLKHCREEKNVYAFARGLSINITSKTNING